MLQISREELEAIGNLERGYHRGGAKRRRKVLLGLVKKFKPLIDICRYNAMRQDSWCG